jgi:hypothetical protein
MILDGKVDEMTEVLRAEIGGAPLSESILAGQKLIGEAQDELNILPPSVFADSLSRLCDALRDLLEQLRD